MIWRCAGSFDVTGSSASRPPHENLALREVRGLRDRCGPRTSQGGQDSDQWGSLHAEFYRVTDGGVVIEWRVHRGSCPVSLNKCGGAVGDQWMAGGQGLKCHHQVYSRSPYHGLQIRGGSLLPLDLLQLYAAPGPGSATD